MCEGHRIEYYSGIVAPASVYIWLYVRQSKVRAKPWKVVPTGLTHKGLNQMALQRGQCGKDCQ